MQKRRLRHAVALDQRATASLETLLVLPFIFLVLVLLVDAGHGLVTRLRADGAVRLWATASLRLAPGQAAETLVRRSYFEDASELRLDGSPRKDVTGSVGIDRPIPGGILLIVSWDDSWQTYGLSAVREPLVGTVLPRLAAEAELTLDNYSWTFDELPITLATTAGPDGLLAQLSQGAGGIGSLIAPLLTFGAPVFEGFYWLLGMEP